jgi:hypothetical protein
MNAPCADSMCSSTFLPGRSSNGKGRSRQPEAVRDCPLDGGLRKYTPPSQRLGLGLHLSRAGAKDKLERWSALTRQLDAFDLKITGAALPTSTLMECRASAYSIRVYYIIFQETSRPCQ